MMLTQDDAKLALHVDSDFDYSSINTDLATAEAICADLARLSAEEWQAISNYHGKSGLTIHSEEKSHTEVEQMRDLLKGAVVEALSYIYTHRGEANYNDLSLSLLTVVRSIRGVVL